MYEILDFFKLNISMDYKDYTVNVFRQRKSYINQFELKYGKCYLWNENYLYIFFEQIIEMSISIDFNISYFWKLSKTLVLWD